MTIRVLAKSHSYPHQQTLLRILYNLQLEPEPTLKCDHKGVHCSSNSIKVTKGRNGKNDYIEIVLNEGNKSYEYHVILNSDQVEQNGNKLVASDIADLLAGKLKIKMPLQSRINIHATKVHFVAHLVQSTLRIVKKDEITNGELSFSTSASIPSKLGKYLDGNRATIARELTNAGLITARDGKVILNVERKLPFYLPSTGTGNSLINRTIRVVCSYLDNEEFGQEIFDMLSKFLGEFNTQVRKIPNKRKQKSLLKESATLLREKLHAFEVTASLLDQAASQGTKLVETEVAIIAESKQPEKSSAEIEVSPELQEVDDSLASEIRQHLVQAAEIIYNSKPVDLAKDTKIEGLLVELMELSEKLEGASRKKVQQKEKELEEAREQLEHAEEISNAVVEIENFYSSFSKSVIFLDKLRAS